MRSGSITLRGAAVASVLAMVLASCELMIAPPPSARPSRAVSTPEATPEPTPTEIDEFETLPPDPSGGALSLTAAAEGLADLGSYRITVATRGVVPSAKSGGAVAMTSTLIQGEQPAARFVLTGADGLTGGRLEAIVVGDEAWVREGGGLWHKSAGGAADFDAAFTTMSPAELAGDFDALAPALHRVAVERRNGIRADHYRADASDAAASAAGLSAGSIDLWTATSGGYLVALALDGTWIGDDGAPVRTVLRIDVTHVNDPSNAVAPPG